MMRFLKNLSINVSIFKKKLTRKFHSAGVSFYSSLSQDLSFILNNVDDVNDYNVIIKAGINPGRKFFAHSIILRARSPYFKSVFLSEWSIKKGDMLLLKKPKINPDVFEMILK